MQMKLLTLQRLLFFLLAVCVAVSTWGQTAPEIGYMHPAGGQAGKAVEVVLGGYDWTPDMQVFVHDPRIKLEIIGPPSKVLVPDPPYWFGAKARGPAWPLPREFAARLTIPADLAPGLVRWQVANANGASPVESFQIGDVPEIVEGADHNGVQALPSLPVTICGQIRKIEEIDQYEFRLPQASLVTLELSARQLNSPLHAMLKVCDPSGKALVDLADTEGRDLAATFRAEANVKYTLALHDLDFAGDRSYVYRLSLHPGPRILAAFPAAGKRGETRRVEFVGVGLATGSAKIETLAQEVAFPAATEQAWFSYELKTPHGAARPFRLGLSDAVELVEPATAEGMPLSQLPAAITGAIERRFGSDRFTATLKKGDKWQIAAQSKAIGSPLDLELKILDAAGKELAASDDVPGTVDPTLAWIVPADGAYTIQLTDRSGKSGDRSAAYRLTIEPQREDFTTKLPANLSVALGGKAKLALPIVRQGGFAGPVQLQFAGLPEGVTLPADLTIPEKKNDLAIELACAADAPANASLVTVSATATLNGQAVTRPLGTVLVATVMKPRFKLTPEGLDDVRKVHRGSTFLAPILIERLEGYQGPIVLEMTAKQQRHRQGLASDEFTAPADATRVEYPIFVPEWMETTKTSRMILNGVVQVPDPRGKMRSLLQKMELRIGILPEGALLKLSAMVSEMPAKRGETIKVPLAISRASDLHEPVRLEFVPQDSQQGMISAEPVMLTGDEREATLAVALVADPKLAGEQTLQFRASALQGGKWAVVSQTTVLVLLSPAG
jgi:hypothetical protein